MNALGIKILAAVLLSAIVLSAYVWWAGHQREIGREEVRAEWRQAVARENEQTAKEQARRMERQQEALNAQTRQTDAARVDAAAARDSRERMLHDLAQWIAARRRAAEAGATASSGPPADSALDLLANLFSRADARAGELAEYADRARIAGQLCERYYDSAVKP